MKCWLAAKERVIQIYSWAGSAMAEIANSSVQMLSGHSEIGSSLFCQPACKAKLELSYGKLCLPFAMQIVTT